MNRLDVVVPFASIAILVIGVIAIYFRQGRNRTLEHMIEGGGFGPITNFRGTLAVQESRPGVFLRLNKNSKGRRLQFFYRWVIGMGPQATADEVTFDASRQSVDLIRGVKKSHRPFVEFSAVRMREDAVSMRRGIVMNGSLWHVELVPATGSRLLFLSSEVGNRQRVFERTAAVAKAVSTIMSIPVQVVVDGNAWTLEWPPKNL